jgi:alkylation response protein AidB-like acyl-CoA dehydrogenase
LHYRAPLRDSRFLLYDVLDVEAHFARLVDRESVTRDLLDPILEQAARFSEEELFALNREADETGCRLENGTVVTPNGFKEAYQTYLETGFAGMVGNPEYGGQGLPPSIRLLAEETMSAANMAWTMYPDLSMSAMHALDMHGTTAQKRLFLTRLLAGEWTGTMCLTEANAGSDVGLLRTRALPRSDGTYGITGTKIFISAGDHDLVANILHLVLARLPDAPAGTRGISLFIVPKFLVRDDGSLGARNRVTCARLEEKMGLHGNATCELVFDDATGFLVGPEHQGMRCMFTMMNSARLGVGMQGLGIMEVAYQLSLAYARERLQMRSLSGPKNPSGPADALIVHPDVRRMLLTQKAFVEGGRALAYYTLLGVDDALFGPREAREEAEARLSFLTPIVKAFLTETGFEAANHALQIFGGHGFVRDTGIEQYVRDARITLIYEGTTQIQALDLLGRKVLMTQGKALLALVAEMKALAPRADGELATLGDALTRIADEWPALTLAIGGRAAADPEEVGAASVDFLMYSGYATLTYLWTRMAIVARDRLRDGPDPFFEGKVATAQFFVARLLPRAESHRRAIAAGAAPLMQITDAAFDHH